MRTSVLSVAIAGALVAAGHAQVEVGARAPVPEAKSLENTKIRSLDALEGRLIAYEFFSHT